MTSRHNPRAILLDIMNEKNDLICGIPKIAHTNYNSKACLQEEIQESFSILCYCNSDTWL